jgi:DNA polymerase-3 subunit delta'
LRNLLREDRLPNGLLFWGPAGVGKRMAALELAKAVNCAGKNKNGCGECLPCRKITHFNHPDVKHVHPAKNSLTIPVKAIEEINEFASLRPHESSWRIFVLHDAERMHPAAQNHFLKTLEEPPGRALFILLSAYPRRLLPTIRSRCQSVRFNTLRRETVEELLRRDRDLPDDLARSIAVIAAGQMSRAIDLVDSEKRQTALALVDRLADGVDPVILAEEFTGFLDAQRKQHEASLKAEFASGAMSELTPADAERLKEERAAALAALVKGDILEYLYLLETWYRDELIVRTTGDTDRVWNVDRIQIIRTKTSTDPAAKIAAIERTRDYLDRSIPEERVFRDLFFTLAAP